VPDFSTVKAQLLDPRRRYRAGDIPAVDGAGVYALFLAAPGALAGVSIEPLGLIYVGMTESSLEMRNHFAHRDSGFSTLRRSLGSLLKAELTGRRAYRRPMLREIPRSESCVSPTVEAIARANSDRQLGVTTPGQIGSHLAQRVRLRMLR
jgi:GIY-YIG catalytic domain-containing protein